MTNRRFQSITTLTPPAASPCLNTECEHTKSFKEGYLLHPISFFCAKCHPPASLPRRLLCCPTGVLVIRIDGERSCLHTFLGRISVCPSGPSNNSRVHRGTKCSENPHRRHLRGQLRPLRCSGHCHNRHTTEERRGRRVRGLRRLHTSGLPRSSAGAHPRRLPDVLRARRAAQPRRRNTLVFMKKERVGLAPRAKTCK